MYIESPNKQELRRGDIFADLFFPMMPCETPRLLGTPPTDEASEEESFTPLIWKVGRFDCLTAQIPLLKAPAILLSQCCDVEFQPGRGGIKRRYLVIAPLTEVLPDMKKDSNYELLTQNNLDKYLNYFYIAQSDPLTNDYIVDFSRVVSIPAAEAPFILHRKILQMTDEMRVRLKVKFSTFFGRPSDDVEQALMTNLRTTELEEPAEATPAEATPAEAKPIRRRTEVTGDRRSEAWPVEDTN